MTIDFKPEAVTEVYLPAMRKLRHKMRGIPEVNLRILVATHLRHDASEPGFHQRGIGQICLCQLRTPQRFVKTPESIEERRLEQMCLCNQRTRARNLPNEGQALFGPIATPKALRKVHQCVRGWRDTHGALEELYCLL